MNTQVKNLAIFFTFSLLFGCVTPRPSPEVLANADYGSFPSDYKKIISSYMELYLKDASSAKYKYIREPQKSWRKDMFGYSACIYLNAKNSFGGYTGYKLHYFFIINNIVFDHVVEEAKYGGRITHDLCSNTGSL